MSDEYSLDKALREHVRTQAEGKVIDAALDLLSRTRPVAAQGWRRNPTGFVFNHLSYFTTKLNILLARTKELLELGEK
jgi:hypothetical protein